MFGLGVAGTVIIIVAFLVVSGIKVMREYQRGVVRLGRLVGARGPGIIYVIPLIERMYRMDLRTITLDVPSQDVITGDTYRSKSVPFSIFE